MQALADFRTVGAVAPSSRYLTRAMTSPLPLQRAQVVVELGCGTGALTRVLLDQMPRQSVLLAFEINPRFASYLRQRISDPRLVLINASAENIRQELTRRGYKQADAVVSSLALTLMSERTKQAILRKSCAMLKPGGVFTQYLYVHGLHWKDGRPEFFAGARVLRRHFKRVEQTIVWRNLPPAFVYTCRDVVS